MKTIVSLDEFRKNLSDMVARVMYGDQTLLVRKHKRNGVVVISEAEYEFLKDPWKRFKSRKSWDKFFVKLDEVRSKMSEKDMEQVERVVDEEVKVVRAEQKQKYAQETDSSR